MANWTAVGNLGCWGVLWMILYVLTQYMGMDVLELMRQDA